MNASSRLAAPRSSISFCGASQARTFPAFISEMRSQRIPSFMKWVVTKIVTPWLRERSISSSQKLSRATGIDAGGGLVQDEDLGLVQDGDGQREALAQAHGQVLGQGVEVRAQPEPLAPARRCAPSPSRAAGGRGGRARTRFWRTVSSP